MELARMGELQQASPIPANIPMGLVTEWTVDDVRNWLSTSMQLPQYLEQFEGTSPPPLQRGGRVRVSRLGRPVDFWRAG